jgi:hypothetical protein
MLSPHSLDMRLQMVHTIKLFVEITTLEPTTVERIYLSLSKNIPQSFIKIYEAGECLMKDVK